MGKLLLLFWGLFFCAIGFYCMVGYERKMSSNHHGYGYVYCPNKSTEKTENRYRNWINEPIKNLIPQLKGNITEIYVYSGYSGQIFSKIDFVFGKDSVLTFFTKGTKEKLPIIDTLNYEYGQTVYCDASILDKMGDSECKDIWHRLPFLMAEAAPSDYLQSVADNVWAYSGKWYDWGVNIGGHNLEYCLNHTPFPAIDTTITAREGNILELKLHYCNGNVLKIYFPNDPSIFTRIHKNFTQDLQTKTKELIAKNGWTKIAFEHEINPPDGIICRGFQHSYILYFPENQFELREDLSALTQQNADGILGFMAKHPDYALKEIKEGMLILQSSKPPMREVRMSLSTQLSPKEIQTFVQEKNKLELRKIVVPKIETYTNLEHRIQTQQFTKSQVKAIRWQVKIE